jgi:hypothetical protein
VANSVAAGAVLRAEVRRQARAPHCEWRRAVALGAPCAQRRGTTSPTSWRRTVMSLRASMFVRKTRGSCGDTGPSPRLGRGAHGCIGRRRPSVTCGLQVTKVARSSPTTTAAVAPRAATGAPPACPPTHVLGSGWTMAMSSRSGATRVPALLKHLYAPASFTARMTAFSRLDATPSPARTDWRSTQLRRICSIAQQHQSKRHEEPACPYPPNLNPSRKTSPGTTAGGASPSSPSLGSPSSAR